MSFSALTRLGPKLRFPSYGRPRVAHRTASLRVSVNDLDRGTFVLVNKVIQASETLSGFHLRTTAVDCVNAFSSLIAGGDRTYYPNSIFDWVAVAHAFNYAAYYNAVLPSPTCWYMVDLAFSRTSKEISISPRVGSVMYTGELAEAYWDMCGFVNPFNAASAAQEWIAAPWSSELSEGLPEVVVAYDSTLLFLPRASKLTDL